MEGRDDLDPNNNSTIATWLGSASGTDDCGTVTLDSTNYEDAQLDPLCGNAGEIVVTFYLSDECENVSTCTAVLVIEDTTAPEVTCPDDLTVQCGDDLTPQNEEISFWLTSATGTDVCGDVSLDSTSYDPEGFSDECGETGEQVVTFYLSDECNNVSTCTATITIIDDIAPEVSCPGMLTIECGMPLDPANNTALAAWLGSASGTDICSEVTLDSTSYDENGYTDDCAETGEQVVTFYLSDDCGNVSTCTATVKIVDTTDPVIACPLDITIECGEDYSDVLATATDICDTDVEVTFTDEVIENENCVAPEKIRETVIRRFVAEDDCGNTSSCTTIITITDTTPPVISCPDDATVQCDSDVPLAELIDPDITGFPTIKEQIGVCPDVPNYEFFNIQITEINPCTTRVRRLWSVTDQCGNGDSSDSTLCVQIIDIVDTEGPTITCPADATIECGDDIPMDGLSATDQCDENVPTPTVLRIDTADAVCPLQLTVVYIATDACGNSSTCTQKVTVEDNTPPMVDCPDPLEIECGESLDPAVNTELANWLASAVASDACGDAMVIENSYSMDGFSDGCGETGEQVVTFIAEDECGNRASCTAIVKIVDTTPPAIACPLVANIECTSNQVIPFVPPVLLEDECGDTTRTYVDEIVPSDCPVVNRIIRTWTVVDDCGLTSSCTQVIQIVDTTPPVVVAPPDQTIECDEYDTADLGTPVANDDCEGPIPAERIELFSEIFQTVDACTTRVRRFFRTTDVCGNGASGSAIDQQIVLLIDTKGPVITVPGDLTAECDGPLPGPNATAEDNCDENPELTFVDSDPVDVDGCVQRVTRTYTASDACGNMTMTTQYIDIFDTTDPVITCPDPATVECAGGSEDTSPSATGMPIVSDNCDEDITPTSSDRIVPGNCEGTYTIFRAWVAVDDCGNVASCTQQIDVVDTTAPMITCPDPLVFDCDFNTTDLAEWLSSGTATDACSGSVTVVGNPTPIQVDPDPCGAPYGVYTYEFTAMDDCGNTSRCTATVTVQDTVGPEIVGACPADEVLSCEEGLVCVDFNTLTQDAEVVSFMAGGVTIGVEAWAKGIGQVEAWVFNTSNPNPGDLDLGTPNILFGGPGENEEDFPDLFNTSNNNDQGNAIVVQNPNSVIADDYFLSDTIIFNFSSPVFLQSIVTVDFESSQASTGARALLYDEDGALIDEVFWSGSQDNGQEEVNFNTLGVSTLKVYFGLGTDDLATTSGAVSRLCFELVEKPEVTWTDNCSAVEDTCIQVLEVNDDCEAIFKNTFYAFDACGNASDTCVQTVTLGIDAIRPQVECQLFEFIPCGESIPAFDPGVVTATDNCTAPENLVITLMSETTLAPIDESGTCTDSVVFRVIKVVDECGNEALCSQFIVPFEQTVEFAGSVLLDAAVIPGQTVMNAPINGILPLSQPYNVAPYGYPGGENVLAMPADVVDWILVELRDPDTELIFSIRSGFVKTDGSIVDTAGNNLVFAAPLGMWEVVLRHRNHLDIVSDVAVDFTSGTGTFNFINGWSAAPSGMKSLGASNYSMYLGDATQDQIVSYDGGFHDRLAVLLKVGFATPSNTVPGYHKEDVNFDGLVSYDGGLHDRLSILLQVGFATPSNTIVGQAP